MIARYVYQLVGAHRRNARRDVRAATFARRIDKHVSAANFVAQFRQNALDLSAYVFDFMGVAVEPRREVRILYGLRNTLDGYNMFAFFRGEVARNAYAAV